MRAEPLTATSLRARPMWDILADYDVPSGIVELAADPARRRCVRLPDQRLLRRSGEFADSVRRSQGRRSDDGGRDRREASSTGGCRPHGRTCCRPFRRPIRAWPGIRRARWDRAYAEAEVELTSWFAPRLTALRLEGVDEFGHAYLRDAEPELFGGVRHGDPERSLLDRYYAYLDSQIERAIAQTGAGRPAAGGVGVRDGTDAADQAAAGAPARRNGHHGLARGGAGRVPDRVRHERRTRRVPRAGRSSIWRRRCSTTWACRSAATWTASPGPTCSASRSPGIIR